MSLFSRLGRTVGRNKTNKSVRRAEPQPRPSQKPEPKFDGQAAREAENQAREIVFAAKEEAMKIRTAAEEEARKLRSELVELERRLAQKEEVVDSKLRSTEEKETSLQTKLHTLEETKAEIEKIKADQLIRLQKIAGLSVEEAKEKILAAVEESSRNEAGKLARGILDEAKEEADKKAREILVSEMIHGATDYVAEYTVSTVTVPNEEVKGRIIGKEGRNIRSFEQATGVDVELDEEGVIRLSSFDSVRREIARVALDRLIRDSRIQPARIEEVVAQVKKEIDRIIAEEGEKLCHSVGVYNLPRPIIELL
jgi:ribonuclease Y